MQLEGGHAVKRRHVNRLSGQSLSRVVAGDLATQKVTSSQRHNSMLLSIANSQCNSEAALGNSRGSNCTVTLHNSIYLM